MNGLLTRKQMEDVIAAGGSVLHNGMILTHVSHLPTSVALAQTAEDKQQALTDIDAQIANLLDQRDKAAGDLRGGKQIGKQIGNLEDANLLDLVAIAKEYGIEDAADFESRVQLVAEIKHVAGYPLGGSPDAAIPSDSSASSASSAKVEQTDTGGPQTSATSPLSLADLDSQQLALNSLSVDKLKETAKEVGVEGFDAMNKKDVLIPAILAQIEKNLASANASGG